MALSERLSMVVSLTLIGLALFFIIDLPTQTWAISWGTLAFTVTTSSRLLMGMLVGGLAFSGAGAVLHGHPARRLGYTVPFWVNATLLAIFATQILGRLGSPLAWAVGLLATGVLLWLTILSEFHLVEHITSHTVVLSSWWSQAMSYVLLLGFALLIFLSTLAIGWKIAALTVVAAACGASILRNHDSGQTGYIVFWGVLVLAMAQFGGLIAFLPLAAIQQALLYLLVFYLLGGIAAENLSRHLSRQTAFEYAAILVVGLFAISRIG